MNWTPGSILAFPEILSQNVTTEESQKHQPQHKKKPEILNFSMNTGVQIYKIQHEDNPNESCNDFHPIRCQQGTDEKVLRLQNDCERYTLNSITN